MTVPSAISSATPTSTLTATAGICSDGPRPETDLASSPAFSINLIIIYLFFLYQRAVQRTAATHTSTSMATAGTFSDRPRPETDPASAPAFS